MEFLKGRIFSDVRLLSLPYEERKKWYARVFRQSVMDPDPLPHHCSWYSAVETLAKLHKVDYAKIGLQGYGRDSGFYERQMKSLGRISEAQAAVKDQDSGETVGPIPRVNELYAWFKRNQVADQATIVHGDYKVIPTLWVLLNPSFFIAIYFVYGEREQWKGR